MTCKLSMMLHDRSIIIQIQHSSHIDLFMSYCQNYKKLIDVHYLTVIRSLVYRINDTIRYVSSIH